MENNLDKILSILADKVGEAYIEPNVQRKDELIGEALVILDNLTMKEPDGKKV